MKLLALLLLFALRRIEFRRDTAHWRKLLDGYLLAPLSLLAMFTRTTAMRLLLLVVFWAAVGFLLRFGLDGVLLSWPLLLIYLWLLWVLIGGDRLGPDLNEYLRLWYLKDEPALREYAQTQFAVAEKTLPQLHVGVLRALFMRGYRETFVWIIVFAVTGLPGLLALAALDATLRDPGGERDDLLAREARDMRARLDWLAVRLLGITFLLTGNSGRAWPILDSRLLDDEDPAAELVADLGVAAAGILPSPDEDPDVGLDIIDARGLVLRTQVIWAMLMAVSVIAGF